MENKAHAIAAGIFVLVLVAVLGGMSVWLTSDRGEYETYELTSPQAVTGLQLQAAVRYKGVAVGKVLYVGFDPDQPGNVLIRVDVDKNTPITASTYASLGYQGVTGLAYIDLDDGRNAQDLGRSPRGHPWLQLRPSNLTQLAAMGPEVISEARDAMTSISALLSDGNQQTLFESIGSIGDLARSSASLVEKIDQSWSNDVSPAINKLSQDTGSNLEVLGRTAESMEEMSRSIALLAQRMGEEGGTIDQVNGTVASFSSMATEVNANTLPRLQRALDELSTSLREITSLARGIEENPQSFIFGPNASRPGPGEAGYTSSAR